MEQAVCQAVRRRNQLQHFRGLQLRTVQEINAKGYLHTLQAGRSPTRRRTYVPLLKRYRTLIQSFAHTVSHNKCVKKKDVYVFFFVYSSALLRYTLNGYTHLFFAFVVAHRCVRTTVTAGKQTFLIIQKMNFIRSIIIYPLARSILQLSGTYANVCKRMQGLK